MRPDRAARPPPRAPEPRGPVRPGRRRAPHGDPLHRRCRRGPETAFIASDCLRRLRRARHARRGASCVWVRGASRALIKAVSFTVPSRQRLEDPPIDDRRPGTDRAFRAAIRFCDHGSVSSCAEEHCRARRARETARRPAAQPELSPRPAGAPGRYVGPPRGRERRRSAPTSSGHAGAGGDLPVRTIGGFHWFSAASFAGRACAIGRRQAVGTLAIGLVDDEDVGHLHEAGLERLHVIARARHERHDGDVRRSNNLDLVLARRRFRSMMMTPLPAASSTSTRHPVSARQAAELPPRGHRSDEDARI